MSDALLRISEAVYIDCEHITEEADGSGRLLLPTSKTDQEGRGAVLYLKPGTLHAVRDYQRRARFMEGPLFRRMQKGDRIDPQRRLTADGARLVIKAAAQAANIPGASGHSFRIGTAQSLVEKGAGLVDLQNAGRWKSADMPAHYTRGQAAGKGAVARAAQRRMRGHYARPWTLWGKTYKRPRGRISRSVHADGPLARAIGTPWIKSVPNSPWFTAPTSGKVYGQPTSNVVNL